MEAPNPQPVDRDLSDDEECGVENTGQVDMTKLDFPGMMAYFQNRTEKIDKLRTKLRKESVTTTEVVDTTETTKATKATEAIEVVEAVEVVGTTRRLITGGTKKKSNKCSDKQIKKKSKCDPEILHYVEAFDETNGQRNILAWATTVLCECSLPVVDKLKSFFKKEKKTDALAGLENAKAIIAKLEDVRASFDAEKIIDLLSEYDFLGPMIDDVIHQWKVSPFVNITKADTHIIRKIIKVFRDQAEPSAVAFCDLCSISSVRNEISDRTSAGFMFDFTKFKKIVDGSGYSNLFTITGDSIDVNREKIEDFIEKTSSSTKFLEADTVISQISNVFKNAVKPTDLQKYLYTLLNSDDNFAVCLDSAPGSGKSTGMLTNENGKIVYLPINVKSYKEMLISLTCARIPFVLAQKNDNGELTYVPSWETMGKIAKYDTSTGEDFENEHALTLVEVYRRLKQLESRTPTQEQRRNTVLKGQEEEACRSKRSDRKLTREDTNRIEASYRRRARHLGKRTFFSSKIKFVVCHPSLRENGAVRAYTHTRDLAEAVATEKGSRCEPVTVIIDDFGANGEDMVRETDVVRLCFGADRIILSSGTCPSGVDAPEFVLNTTRVAKGRQPFVHKSFNKTLGLGVELNYVTTGATTEAGATTEERFSLLSCDKSVFDKSPTALQTITMNDAFEFLKLIHGTGIRNFLLERFLTVTLDDLRQEVFDWVYSLSDQVRASVVHDVIENVVQQGGKPSKIDHRIQTLYLSNDPEHCARKYFGDIRAEMQTYDGITMPYLDFVQHRVNNHTKAIKAQNKEIESFQKRKTVEKGATTESLVRDLGEVTFNKSGIDPMFDKKFIEGQLGYRGTVADIQIHFLLQKGVLLVDERSADTWIDVGIKKAVQNIVGYPVQMGVGVDMPKLTKVHLGHGTSPAITRQNMGRVGRSSQGCQGSVVFPDLNMLTELFDADVGDLLRPIFYSAVNDVMTRRRQHS